MVYSTAGIIPISNIKMGMKTKWKQERWGGVGVGQQRVFRDDYLVDSDTRCVLFWNSHKDEILLENIVYIWQMKTDLRSE